VASRVGPLASHLNLMGGCSMSRNARKLRLREGRHIRVGWRRGLVLLLQGLEVLALHLLELPLLFCGPLLVLGIEELVEAGLDVAPPNQQIISGNGQIEVGFTSWRRRGWRRAAWGRSHLS
jgi:hypothetical protein